MIIDYLTHGNYLKLELTHGDYKCLKHGKAHTLKSGITICKFFQDHRITLNFIEKEFGGLYWEQAKDFIFENWHKDISSLKPEQIAWLYKIFQDCIDKRVRG